MLLTTLPLTIYNYYTFVKDDKYKTLIQTYKGSYNKLTFAIYFCLSILFPIIYVMSTVKHVS
jgi:hypothetical protein